MNARESLQIAAIALPLVVAADARADAIHDCVEAANSGQALRDSGKLTAARKAFVTCSADACPTVVRDSCRRWDAEIEPRVPTVTFAAAATTGEDLANAHVSIDGALVAPKIDGRAILIDPGAHEIVFEAAGFVTSRQQVVIREGEKARVVSARLARPPSEAAPIATTAPPRRVAPLVVSGAVAGVGLAGFAILGAVGQSDHDRLASTCAAKETCKRGEVRDARNEWIAADVSLAVGVVGAGVFTAFALAPLFRRPSTSAFVAPAPHGAMFVLRITE